MLEKLATINWSGLTHAYGDASDVPDLLWALASRKRRDRLEALQALFNNIWHQGTVFEATSFAVPFLYELLRNPSVQGKTGILQLIQSIMSAHVPDDAKVDVLWREKPSPRDVAVHAECSKWALHAFKAGSAGVDTLITLLADSSPLVRGTAAFTLSYCAERHSEIETRLQLRIDEEHQAVVKAALIHVWSSRKFSARNSATAQKKLWQLARSRQEKPVVRLLSGLGLLQFLRERAYPNLTRFLVWGFRKSGKAMACLSRFDACFDVWQALADRPDLKLELRLALANRPNRSVKEHILFDLEGLCRESRSNFAKVIPVLGQLVGDGDPEFRAHVALRLSQMGTWTRFAREPLLHALKDANPEVALRSAVALSKLREQRVLPFLFTNLGAEKHMDSPSSQTTEAKSISETLRIQQATGKHLQGLRLLLEALRSYGPDASEAVPTLRTLLMERGPDIQKMACGALASIGEPAVDTVPLVASLLRQPETQCEAAWALERWGLNAAKAIPDLIRFLQDFRQADTWSRTSAIMALGNLGVNARDALPLLENHLLDRDCSTKCEAALAIWRIAPRTPEVIEVLVAELKEKTKPGWAIHGCIHVVKALEAIGPDARSAVPLLEKLLGDPDAWSRVHAARALWKMRSSMATVLPVLIDDLLCRPLGITTGILAAECLAEIGPSAEAAIPRLTEILARDESLAHHGTGWVESDEAYRIAVSNALHRIGGRS